MANTIKPGSWILVTGASGFLASHIVLQFLERGYRVRGTVRNIDQASWLLEGRFKTYATDGNLELVSVPDMGADDAFDAAVRGVAAVLHTAYITNIVPDPNKVITPLVASVRSIMGAARKEPLVQKVVFTSSAIVTSPLKPDVDNGVIGRDSWNDAALDAAWAPPPYGISHAMANYPASKVAEEKEAWKLAKENTLPFSINVVSPAGMIGEPLDKKHIEGQANWIVHAYRGNKMRMDPLPASYYADVKDIALIHVAAVLDPEIKNARLQSWGLSTHWNDILALLREFRPERKFVDDYPERTEIRVSVDQSDALAILKKWGGQSEWTPLRDSVQVSIDTPWLEN
ncbi:Aldehyde 2 [Cyphellophora attinorum]|uniref:Aldehyde 2 n=1 Tax=Cyphellophora attinorum TaxID=1664694 RepID=A0A0N0NQ16_9EURO|nr:Aldehyde 2 [Phialophora attinorum]KPI43391.1 Aldehyde 2 [Phialophora attinorum]